MECRASTGIKVDLARFAVLVDAYGACPDNWPEQERVAALELLGSSAAAVRLRDQALALDLLLDAMPTLEPSTRLIRHVLDSVPGRSAWAERWLRLARWIWPFGPTWQPATALATAAALGVSFGFSGFEEFEVGGEGTVVSELLLGSDDSEDYWGEP